MFDFMLELWSSHVEHFFRTLTSSGNQAELMMAVDNAIVALRGTFHLLIFVLFAIEYEICLVVCVVSLKSQPKFTWFLYICDAVLLRR